MGKLLMIRAYGGAYLQEERSFVFNWQAIIGPQLHVEILIYLFKKL